MDGLHNRLSNIYEGLADRELKEAQSEIKSLMGRTRFFTIRWRMTYKVCSCCGKKKKKATIILPGSSLKKDGTYQELSARNVYKSQTKKKRKH